MEKVLYLKMNKQLKSAGGQQPELDVTKIFTSKAQKVRVQMKELGVIRKQGKFFSLNLN